ncbi:MAG: dienelactone hydrolase [Acidobacteria bacterium]|nr:dienelactone hydrolase [Acidobacteriota bacterium]
MAAKKLALLLTPGAGSGRDHSSLLAIEKAVTVPVLRHDFPYRRNGKKAPDRAPVLLTDIREAAASFVKEAGVKPDRLILGGRSMGGRICSMAVAGVPETGGEQLPAAGLVLISYPLHPPGKPERMRTEHLPRLEVPCLFISGTRDAFGTPDELGAATAAIAGPVEHVWVERGTHDLKGADDLIASTVSRWLKGL